VSSDTLIALIVGSVVSLAGSFGAGRLFFRWASRDLRRSLSVLARIMNDPRFSAVLDEQLQMTNTAHADLETSGTQPPATGEVYHGRNRG
jgi:hypothetical protein